MVLVGGYRLPTRRIHGAGGRRCPGGPGSGAQTSTWSQVALQAGTVPLTWGQGSGAKGSSPRQGCCRWQKVSLWSWFGGSGCTIIAEAHELSKLAEPRRKGENEAEYKARRAKAMSEVDGRLLTLVHALFQVRHSGAPVTRACSGLRCGS